MPSKPNTKQRRRRQRRKAFKKAAKTQEEASWVDDIDLIPIGAEDLEEEEEYEERASLSKETARAADIGEGLEPPPEEEDNTNDGSSLSICSWNILAQSYCSSKSHPCLPKQSQVVAFCPAKRRKLISNILQERFLQNKFDVICLQEVDLTEEVSGVLSSEYSVHETPRSRATRIDSCGIYVRKKHWTVLHEEVICLDDLATLQSKEVTDVGNDESKRLATSTSNIQGIQQAFMRRNQAIVVRIQNTISGRIVVISNAHLYWNPAYEYVKVREY